MCGIAGAVNWGDPETLARMTDVQAHRGPDDRGTSEAHLQDGSWVGLGSRRLAILDLTRAGHMPMKSPDGLLTIVYNGEIYNYPQLRSELEKKGFHFRSNSDTEAVLYLYMQEGENCLRRLKGMFAFAILDEKRQQLFLARDHFGIKPLYYFQEGKRFAFASEAKAFLELPDFERRLNYAALSQYLTFLWVPDPLTMLDGVLKLPAGHFAIFKNSSLAIKPYWDLKYPDADYQFKVDEAELARELRERFIKTTRSQLLSDVPVGAFLSAGMDSSSIVAAMATASDEPVRTFTIEFPEKYRRGEVTLDDTAVARRTADYFGCRHTSIMVEPNVVELLPRLIWHMDEPLADPAIIAAFLVNREARKDVTVLLSGVGGDELFAGYRKHQAHFLAERYRRLPWLLRERLLRPLVESLPTLRGTRFKGHARLAKKMVRSGSFMPAERFIMDSVYLTEEHKAELYATQARENINGADPRRRHFEYFDNVADADFLNQMLYVDTKAFMTSLNLNYNDKMSMASSVEVRVPFLDWELAEWVAWNVPPHLKLNGGTTKHILREAMRPLLPAEVLNQSKAGFGAPVDYWLANELTEMVDDILSDKNLRARGLFEPRAVRHMVNEQRSGRRDWSAQIWQFLTLELWMRCFIDAN